MKKIILILGTAGLISSIPAFAAYDSHTGAVESCLAAVLAKRPGNVISLEAELENGKPIYEFDIIGKDGKEWEVECDAKTAAVTEVEEEVKATDTLEAAKKLALAEVPGEVIETETSIEADGSISYEFDIKGKDGKEYEVEVDAVTGKLAEKKEQEIYQIGLD
jgi:uncharacterized membrane protein YkoI